MSEIALRDWVDKQIDHVNALRCADSRRTNDRLDATAKALELQAKEYDRRLDDLNHHRHQKTELELSKIIELQKRLDNEISVMVTRVAANSDLVKTLQARAIALAGIAALFGGSVATVLINWVIS